MSASSSNVVNREYLPLPQNSTANYLRIELYYSLGTYHPVTQKHERRGYYLSVSPVTREEKDGYTLESYTAYTGTKMLLLTCERKSKKKEAEAIKAAGMYRDLLIQKVVEENNLPGVVGLQ